MLFAYIHIPYNESKLMTYNSLININHINLHVQPIIGKSSRIYIQRSSRTTDYVQVSKNRYSLLPSRYTSKLGFTQDTHQNLASQSEKMAYKSSPCCFLQLMSSKEDWSICKLILARSPKLKRTKIIDSFLSSLN